MFWLYLCFVSSVRSSYTWSPTYGHFYIARSHTRTNTVEKEIETIEIETKIDNTTTRKPKTETVDRQPDIGKDYG
jgi:hypothetical protein